MGQTYPEPPPDGSLTPAYVPEVEYFGGSPGNEISQSTANATTDFFPKTQVEKASITGNEMVQDVGTPGGWVEPGAPYTPPPPDPVISGISPDTGEIGGDPINVTITGTGFTQWSTVTTGGLDTPYFQVMSDTTINVVMDAGRSVAGPTDIVVTDHGVASAPATFTFTDPAG